MKNKIDFKELKKIVDFMEEKDLGHFEMEVEGFRINLSKNQQHIRSFEPIHMITTAQDSGVPLPPETQTSDQPGEQDNLHFVLSPMVGTFYRAPDPSSQPFIEVGESVQKNQTLCIIEAMKLMNEIESDIDGVVEEIFVENGKPIEYGQRLFSIIPQ